MIIIVFFILFYWKTGILCNLQNECIPLLTGRKMTNGSHSVIKGAGWSHSCPFYLCRHKIKSTTQMFL